MSLYKGSQATESVQGKSYDPGPYKFKITNSTHEEGQDVKIELATWDASGGDGPKILDYINITSDSKAKLAETDRRLTTIMGKPELNSADDLVGKSGWVMLIKVDKFLEPMSFGGYFTTSKKSATGSTESFLTKANEASEFNWEDDPFYVRKVERRRMRQGNQSPPSTPETDDDMPF